MSVDETLMCSFQVRMVKLMGRIRNKDDENGENDDSECDNADGDGNVVGQYKKALSASCYLVTISQVYNYKDKAPLFQTN